MKYIISILSLLSIVLIFLFCPLNKPDEEIEYLRIHIRANSNTVEDQNIKYKVKDAIVDGLIPLLSEVKTFDEATRLIKENFDYIENIADNVLTDNQFNYRSKAELKNEFFPTRAYDDIVLEEGFYDALILNLGSGEGNNWWCIVFPAFCFTKSKNSDNFVYISLIWEIIKSVM